MPSAKIAQRGDLGAEYCELRLQLCEAGCLRNGLMCGWCSEIRPIELPTFFHSGLGRDVHPYQGGVEHAGDIAICFEQLCDDAVVDSRIGFHLPTI